MATFIGASTAFGRIGRTAGKRVGSLWSQYSGNRDESAVNVPIVVFSVKVHYFPLIENKRSVCHHVCTSGRRSGCGSVVTCSGFTFVLAAASFRTLRDFASPQPHLEPHYFSKLHQQPAYDETNMSAAVHRSTPSLSVPQTSEYGSRFWNSTASTPTICGGSRNGGKMASSGIIHSTSGSWSTMSREISSATCTGRKRRLSRKGTRSRSTKAAL